MTQGQTVAAEAVGTPTIAGSSAGAWLLGTAGATSGRQAEVVAPPDSLKAAGVPAVEVRAGLDLGATVWAGARGVGRTRTGGALVAARCSRSA